MSSTTKAVLCVGVLAFLGGMFIGAKICKPEVPTPPEVVIGENNGCGWPDQDCGDPSALMQLDEIEAWANEDLARNWITPPVHMNVIDNVNRCKDPDLRMTDDFKTHVCDCANHCAWLKGIHEKATTAHNAPDEAAGQNEWMLCADDLEQFPSDRGCE